jgi:hypothetical protein
MVVGYEDCHSPLFDGRGKDLSLNIENDTIRFLFLDFKKEALYN